MNRPHLLLTVEDRVATITFDRPESFNALSLQLASELRAAVTEISERDDIGALVIRGNGPAFCAGGDVHEMAAAADRPAFLAELAGALHESLLMLSELGVVVITAATGAVAGGGLGVFLAGDISVVGEDATFSSAYSGVGLTPDCGVSTLLPAAVGLHRSLQITAGGRRLNAAEALDWGITGRVVPADLVHAEAHTLALAIANGPSAALGATRRLLRAAQFRTYSENLDVEAASLSARGGMPEAEVRIAAFSAKSADRVSH